MYFFGYTNLETFFCLQSTVFSHNSQFSCFCFVIVGCLLVGLETKYYQLSRKKGEYTQFNLKMFCKIYVKSAICLQFCVNHLILEELFFSFFFLDF